LNLGAEHCSLQMNSTEASGLALANEKLAEYWKDDFAPLQAAGATINDALRADEDNADLYRRICEGTTPGSHLYFPADTPTDNPSARNQGFATQSPLSTGPVAAAARSTLARAPPPLMRLEHRRSVNLPPLIAQELSTTGKFIRMGLLSEANLAFVIVNEKLYVWSYAREAGLDSAGSSLSSPSFSLFTTPSKENVATVGLVRPKRGT
jgi:Nup133 N terminal like